MHSFKEFQEFIALKTSLLPIMKHPTTLLFLVTYPDKFEWDYGVEKQTQMTYLQMSGGGTGAGHGNYIKLCKQSEVLDLLKKETGSTHAMICSVGMIFVVTKVIKGYPDTAIVDFKKFSESKKYCKAHIIAKPNLPAHLHHQHIELNLDIWREIGCPDIYEKFEYEERSKQNYHDDYTPLWIKPKEFPKIHNFTKKQREKKAFSYGHTWGMYHNATWKDIREDRYNFDIEHKNFYFSRLNSNFNQKSNYYIENNEHLGKLPKDREFDLLFSPCAGFMTEALAHKLNFNGKIIIYDYTQKHLDIKKQILDTNPDFDELGIIDQMNPEVVCIWNQKYQKARPNSFGTFEEMKTWQVEMCANYVIDFWLMDLIEPDYNRLLKEVKGKTVFFNASNIFSYNKIILKYTLPELYKSFDKLFEILKQTEDFYFRGTVPLKKYVRGDNESILKGISQYRWMTYDNNRN